MGGGKFYYLYICVGNERKPLLGNWSVDAP